MARSPKHDARYIERREIQLAVLDAMSSDERDLVCEYGFDRAMPVVRQYYGRWDAAREVLEAERQALQVERWKNIRISLVF